MKNNLEIKLKQLPKSPGIYLYKSKKGEIIYIGKAAILKNRVRQYFQKSKFFDAKTSALVKEMQGCDIIFLLRILTNFKVPISMDACCPVNQNFLLIDR